MTAKEALDRIKNRFGTWAINHIKEFEVLEQALEELEAIKSADSVEAMESLKLLDKEWQIGEELESEEQIAHCSALENAGDIIENYLLKAQAQERELRELKATPTEQEVCEAYYKCRNTPLVYDKTLKQFTEIKGGRAQGRIIARLRCDNLDIPHILPPHLVEMIGKFYKGKVKE